MKALTANKWLWFCFVNRYLAFRSMKLTTRPTNKVNVLRLSDIRNSWVGAGLGRPSLTKLSVAFGNADPLKDDESEHSKTEGPKSLGLKSLDLVFPCVWEKVPLMRGHRIIPR